ncbi:MAG: DUF2017 family protein [Microbacterium sp.]
MLTMELVLEGAHPADLVSQFLDVLGDAADTGVRDDPAVARLVPDAYRGDAEAAAEFRRYTEADLLQRGAAPTPTSSPPLSRARASP